MKKFNYIFEDFKLFPTMYKFYTKKQVENYFDELEKKVSYFDYKKESLEYFEEKIHVVHSRKILCNILITFFSIVSIYLAYINGFDFLNISLFISSIIFFILRKYYSEKFQTLIINRNMVETFLDTETITHLEEKRKSR
jgi:hypothetical protein